MKAGKCRIIEFIKAVLADSAVKREKTVSGRGGRIEPEFTAAEEGHRRCGGGAGEAMELERSCGDEGSVITSAGRSQEARRTSRTRTVPAGRDKTVEASADGGGKGRSSLLGASMEAGASRSSRLYQRLMAAM